MRGDPAIPMCGTRTGLVKDAPERTQTGRGCGILSGPGTPACSRGTAAVSRMYAIQFTSGSPAIRFIIASRYDVRVC